MTDPLDALGLDPGATADDVRRARRELAKRAHPDAGGSASDMQAINAAAAAALKAIAEPPTPDRDPRPDAAPSTGSTGSGSWNGDWSGQRSDNPSFTVEALPVETFEALLLAAAVLGEIDDDDPPYGLSVLLAAPLTSWCRLDVVPDAGASTVSVSIGHADGHPLPPIEAVRNAWVEQLNLLDWSEL